MGALAWKIAEPAPAERRHDQRFKVRLLGRFMRSDRKEFDCESIDASPYGIAFFSHAGVQPGERIFVVLSSGGLSLTQSVLTLLRRDFDQGRGLAAAPSMYDAARAVGEQVRHVADLDRPALERDDFKFNVNLILGGQVRGEPPNLYLIYPQGNPLAATEDSPYLQIGECKYGRPILDRGVRRLA